MGLEARVAIALRSAEGHIDGVCCIPYAEPYLHRVRVSILSLSSRSLQRSQSLQEQAYQAIRAAILSGELPPGQRLIETQLAQKLQVSRTPIREALRQLQNEDLAVLEAHNVLTVATFSVNDARQLYDCRIVLEQLAVSEACTQGSEAQMQGFLEIVVQSEKLAEGKSSQLTSFQLLDADYRFHRHIAEMSGNLWLRSLLDRVFDKMLVLRIQTTESNRQVLDVGSEHRQIYTPISQRNVEAAVQAMTAHLNAAKTRVIEELKHLQSAPSSAAQEIV
jgi:DNA-binding GntR family transcriptional regulator